MKLADLVKEGTPLILSHPIIGKVLWSELDGPGSGYCLYFTDGKRLIADITVISCDLWEVWKNARIP